MACLMQGPSPRRRHIQTRALPPPGWRRVAGPVPSAHSLSPSRQRCPAHVCRLPSIVSTAASQNFLFSPRQLLKAPHLLQVGDDRSICGATALIKTQKSKNDHLLTQEQSLASNPLTFIIIIRHRKR